MAGNQQEEVYEKVVSFFISNGISCGEDIYQQDLRDETNFLLSDLLDILELDKEE